MSVFDRGLEAYCIDVLLLKKFLKTSLKIVCERKEGERDKKTAMKINFVTFDFDLGTHFCVVVVKATKKSSLTELEID